MANEAIHTAYSQSDLSATLDGRQVVGWADGDNSLEVAPNADAGTGLVGSGGSSIFSQSADRSATITLRLLLNSPTARFLQRITKSRQRKPFAFEWKNVGTGEGGVATACWVQTRPNVTQGANATAREFVIWTGHYDGDIPKEVG